MADSELFCKAGAAGGVFNLILDNFRCRASGILFSGAEQVRVVALPLIADQLLQLFKREAGNACERILALSAEQCQLSG